jgi:hypothetical protein
MVFRVFGFGWVGGGVGGGGVGGPAPTPSTLSQTSDIHLTDCTSRAPAEHATKNCECEFCAKSQFFSGRGRTLTPARHLSMWSEPNKHPGPLTHYWAFSPQQLCKFCAHTIQRCR